MILKFENAAIGEVPPIELSDKSTCIVVGIEESGIYLVCVTTRKVRLNSSRAVIKILFRY